MISPHGAMRTHAAGELRSEHVGQTVTLAGWAANRRDHGGVAFIDLRDRSGLVQIVADIEGAEALEAAHRVRSEYVLRVTGEVRARPDGMVNDKLDTGTIEVAVRELEVLSAAQTPPFPIEDGGELDEALRLRHRYLDLRRPEMGHMLRVRAQLNSSLRTVMERHGFLEVETPMLTRATPEGARDFLVPSRLQPGKTYALPQSPQLFKQLLQVAGVERYYQIVRCFRDEDLRADRQPEFTQLDVELSFGDEEDVFALGEELVRQVWSDVLDVDIPAPFRRMPWDEAMERYGSDKPDLRFDLELRRLDEVFANTEVGVFKGVLGDGGSVIAVAVPGGGDMTRKQFDAWQDWAKRRGAKGLAWGVIEDDGTLRSPLAKFMNDDEIAGLTAATESGPGDAIFFGAGPTRWAQEFMGAFRNAIAKDRGLIDPDRYEMLWVVDFPMWEQADDGWAAAHHPFTAPTAACEDTFDTDPANARSRAYDLVINGHEAAGGSIRIHRQDMQSRVFRFLGIDEEEADDKFGFLLRGLSYGAPPHGGIAAGLDRWTMLLTGRDNIRDTIAFPKTQSGSCPLTDAPAAYEPGSLDALALRLAPQAKAADATGGAGS